MSDHHKTKPSAGSRNRPAKLNGYHRSRRGALVLTGADRQLLASLPADRRDLVKDAMRSRPGITAAEALKALRDGGA